ncbi:MAG: recombinase family protein [bacterium]|uniref:Recombinase family protein n=1 Tax=Candidatus Methylomirabilis tolerans TaxID=3123416 RepID=A0AAJ1EJ31_9BACT|nr:recombinase family protein [Candidatus Methylomirabilis sp.]
MTNDHTRPIQVKLSHLERNAAVYERVSSHTQVEESVGSIAHQENQREHACRMGWSPDQIEVYQGDLGISATGRVPRPDWQRLLRDIANGKVGAVFSADHSRLSRSAASFEALLEVCCTNDTLLVIDGVIVDPSDPNDRFMARIRANFSEFENAHRTERMRKSRRAKANSGYPVSRPPIGYISVRRGNGQHWIKDPNPQVRQRILDVFRQYESLGTVRKVLKWLKEHNLKLPGHTKKTGALQWNNPCYIAIYGILTNVAYAGCYQFGRKESWPPGARGKLRSVPQDKWIVKPGLHHGYITMATWNHIQERLHSNQIMDGSQPAGSGNALCQGRVTCGLCGRHMNTRYPARQGPKSGRKKYVCWEANIQYDDPKCIQIDGEVLDALVVREVLTAFAPPEVETLLAAAHDENAGYTAVRQQREEELERARSKAQILKAHVLQVDARQRLAAAELHKDLNEALTEVQELERRHRDQPLVPPLRPTTEAIKQIRQLAADLPALWTDPATTNQDRKRLIRLVLHQVCVVSVSPTGWEVAITWASGTITSHTVICPWAWQAAARELAAKGLAPAAIAEALALRGFRTRMGTTVTAQSIRHLFQPPKWQPVAHELATQDFSPAAIAKELTIRGFKTRGVTQ